MSALTHLFDLQERIFYVQCGFCTTILVVSVPCSSLSMAVTVRCGQCTSLLSVDMNKASLTHLQPRQGGNPDEHASKTCSNHEKDDRIPISYVINKFPKKKQRTPSAYNNFIKEEIKRLKAENPDMAHKEAFSTAAKNWANFPQPYLKGDKEECSQTEQLVDAMQSHVDPYNDAEVNEGGQGFRQRERFQ